MIEKTGKKSGTVGDLWDEAKKASEARKKVLGYDPVKEKHFKKYLCWDLPAAGVGRREKNIVINCSLYLHE